MVAKKRDDETSEPAGTREILTSVPTWECFDGTCSCGAHPVPDESTLRLVLFDRRRRRLPRVHFEVDLGDQVVHGVTNAAGVAEIPDAGDRESCTVRWKHAPGEEGDHFDFELTVFLRFDEGERARATHDRLRNLGYSGISDADRRARSYEHVNRHRKDHEGLTFYDRVRVDHRRLTPT